MIVNTGWSNTSLGKDTGTWTACICYGLISVFVAYDNCFACHCLMTLLRNSNSLILTGEKPDRKVELRDFHRQYSSGNLCDVPVATMRHIIPLFLMEVYSEIYGQYSFKGT